MSESSSAAAEVVIAELRAGLAQRDRALAERDVVIESLLGRIAEQEARLGEELPELLEAAVLGCVRQAAAEVVAEEVGAQAR